MLTLEKTADETATMPFSQPTDARQVGNATNTGNYPLPAPCAWCEREAGERTQGSHTVCARHGCLELLRFHVPAATVRDWALKQPHGEAGFNAAMKLLAQEVAA